MVPAQHGQDDARWHGGELVSCDSRVGRLREAVYSQSAAKASDVRAMMAGVRMDKWLWAARFFKTRALAARACEFGRIESNGQQAKAARDVRVGDLLRIKNDGGEYHVEVLNLS